MIDSCQSKKGSFETSLASRFSQCVEKSVGMLNKWRSALCRGVGCVRKQTNHIHTQSYTKYIYTAKYEHTHTDTDKHTDRNTHTQTTSLKKCGRIFP